jgi:hypothetical protein
MPNDSACIIQHKSFARNARELSELLQIIFVQKPQLTREITQTSIEPNDQLSNSQTFLLLLLPTENSYRISKEPTVDVKDTILKHSTPPRQTKKSPTSAAFFVKRSRNK